MAAIEEKPAGMTLDEVIQYFNGVIKEAENFRSPARASHLQEEQCLALEMLLHNAASIKRQAAQSGDENVANLFLGYECAIGGVRSELLMWLLLKRDKPNEAWEQLVAAQMACLDATRADVGFTHCEQRLLDLQDLEDKVFPPQSFVSPGFISDSLGCSICGQRYSSCEHLRGKPYMGQFCEVIHRNPRGDHVALVDVPADKRCRVVSFKTADGYRDKLSWEVSPYTDEETFKDDGSLEVQTILLATDRYPYLAPLEQILGPLEA